jgi:hypothetical protein
MVGRHWSGCLYGIGRCSILGVVVVGLVFTVISMLTIDLLLWRSKQPVVTRPFTYYAAVAYTIGGALGIALRFGLKG